MLKKNSAGYVPPAGADSSLTDGPDINIVNPSEQNAIFTNRSDVGGIGASRSSGFDSYSDSQYISRDSNVVGSSDDDMALYDNAYQLLKEYPYWLSLLKQNPYTGFTAPQSIWDELGLSNKAQDKLDAMRAAYRQYISDLLLKFVAWRNSLPSEQRTQAVQAGYNPDTLAVQPSQVSDESIKPTSNPFDIASDNTGDQLMTTFSAVMASMATAIQGTSQLVSLVQGVRSATVTREKIQADIDAQNLKNFKDAYEIAKTIFGETSEPVESEDGEIAPAFEFDVNGAPESVSRILNQFQHSRGFGIAQKKSVVESKNVDTSEKVANVASKVADTASVVADSDRLEADMKLEQNKILFGSNDLWRNLRKEYNRAMSLQLENINSYLELFNPLLAAQGQNALNSYFRDFYQGLDASSAATAQNDYIRHFTKLIEFNAENLRQRKMALELRGQNMNELFESALDERWYMSFNSSMAKMRLMVAQDLNDLFGANKMQSDGSPSGVGSPVIGLPQIDIPQIQ